MKRALVSVSDKTNLVEFVSGLVDLGYEIISTGCRENGAPNVNWSKWPTEKTDELTGRDSQIFACQLARSRSAEGCGSPAATSKGHRPFKAPTEPTGETSSLQGSKVKPLPSDMMLCVIYYWVLSGAKWKKPSQLMAILLVL